LTTSPVSARSRTASSCTSPATKVRDETGGNRLVNLAIELRVTFPEGTAGDAAREALPRAARMSHDRLCTVSRMVELGTPVDTRTGASPAGRR
jgi:putative redox protein